MGGCTTPMTSAAARDLPGGTAPGRVAAARDEATREITMLRAWVLDRRRDLDTVFTRPVADVADELESGTTH